MFGKIKNFFTSVKEKLVKSSSSIKETVSTVFKENVQIDDKSLDQITEALILSDISMHTTDKLVSNIKQRLKNEKFEKDDSQEFFLDLISQEVIKILSRNDTELTLDKELSIILISGVNGSGKTTTCGKLSMLLSKITDKKIMLVAADTFRAAAIDQLEVWSQRSNCDFYSSEQKDPASVVYSALDKAKEQNIEILIIDTAGRLSNNVDLMSEISKVEKIIINKTGKKPTESLLVLDGTSGQNSISQVKNFKDALDLSGVIITKLDSTSKAGFAISVSYDYGLPIKFIGVGEKIEDLIPFNEKEFGEALFK